jgi:hypothetical protein
VKAGSFVEWKLEGNFLSGDFQWGLERKLKRARHEMSQEI